MESLRVGREAAILLRFGEKQYVDITSLTNIFRDILTTDRGINLYTVVRSSSRFVIVPFPSSSSRERTLFQLPPTRTALYKRTKCPLHRMLRRITYYSTIKRFPR